jgi:hypothetical protein
MSDFIVDNKTFYKIQYNFLVFFSFILKITVFLYITGFLNIKPPYLLQINFVLKITVALFLMYRFNSFRIYQIRLTELDRKIANSAGLYILVVSFADIINQYTEELRSFFLKYNHINPSIL